MNAAVLGSAALWGAIATSAATVLPGIGARNRSRALRLAAVLAILATAVLAIALIAGDFSLSYVAKTTSRATPWPYRLAAVWGGMEGSMLFYAALTLAIGWLGLRRTESDRLAIGVVGLVGFGYLLIAALAANPFDTLDIPAVDGEGLLAILQHPAMIYHPPILYLGLTSLVVPAALTFGAVLRADVDRAWLIAVRRWLFVSWALLTVGMVSGANWAYVELGWGGFWAWDPVENTALMPWLAATVFLHTSRIQERDGRLRRWNVLFALLPFALTILGVYLTRSGVTGSIHSFAEDPVIGRTLLSAAVVGVVGVAWLTARSAAGAGWEELNSFRGTWLAVSGGLTSTALVFVTIGTAYPAYAQVFFDETVIVDSVFFVTTVYPLAVVIGLLTAFALETRWTKQNLTARHAVFWLVSAAAVGTIALAASRNVDLVPLVLLAVSGAAVLAVGRRVPTARQGTIAGHLAHLGLAMVLLGAAGSALGAEFSGVMAPGDSVDVGGRQVRLTSIDTGEADRFVFVEATFEVDSLTTLTPEIRGYEEQATPIAEPDIHSTPIGDVIVAISRLSSDAGAVNVSVFVRPMVWWVWAGALTMALAGLAALVSGSSSAAAQRRSATEGQPRGGTTTDTHAR